MPLNCAQLAAQVANDVTDFYPPVEELVIQVLTLAPAYVGGTVISANYSGVAPVVSPTQAAIAIDSVTRRQWQWANNVWT